MPEILSIHSLRIGSLIVVRPNFGTDEPVQAKVTGFGVVDIHDVVDYTPVVGRSSSNWAFMDQVDEVVSF